MKYSYEFFDEQNLISIVQQDLYHFNEVKDFINALIEDPRYKPTYNFYIDLRKIKYTPIIDEMVELSEYIISLNSHFKGKAAIITSNYTHHYLFKFAAYMASKNGLISRIFCNPEYALKWLFE